MKNLTKLKIASFDACNYPLVFDYLRKKTNPTYLDTINGEHLYEIEQLEELEVKYKPVKKFIKKLKKKDISYFRFYIIPYL